MASRDKAKRKPDPPAQTPRRGLRRVESSDEETTVLGPASTQARGGGAAQDEPPTRSNPSKGTTRAPPRAQKKPLVSSEASRLVDALTAHERHATSTRRQTRGKPDYKRPSAKMYGISPGDSRPARSSARRHKLEETPSEVTEEAVESTDEDAESAEEEEAEAMAEEQAEAAAEEQAEAAADEEAEAVAARSKRRVFRASASEKVSNVAAEQPAGPSTEDEALAENQPTAVIELRIEKVESPARQPTSGDDLRGPRSERYTMDRMLEYVSNNKKGAETHLEDLKTQYKEAVQRAKEQAKRANKLADRIRETRSRCELLRSDLIKIEEVAGRLAQDRPTAGEDPQEPQEGPAKE